MNLDENLLAKWAAHECGKPCSGSYVDQHHVRGELAQEVIRLRALMEKVPHLHVTHRRIDPAHTLHDESHCRYEGGRCALERKE